ncbi:hypothetical protein [Rhizobium lusitanum]|uniref:Uncharacterized protein n=1 Tax=Rhizobium lusitanum TaxID=293958 RepID=A0A7X0MBR1_9HYPH|nr:hypothetical protein [Rhizobium lusitanum]MBB6485047.1 hypothetical protein [Rhizobium lusitanum]
MNSDETELSRVVAELQRCWQAGYAAFADYLCPEALDVSPLWDPEKIMHDLRSASLADLSGEALGGYAVAAMTTAGGVDEYRYYLPRILQHALMTPNEPGFDPVTILSKLEYANWRKWPAPEQLAIQNVYDASWHWVRLQHPDEFDATIWFVCAIRLRRDINPILESWRVNLTPNSALQLTEIINRSDSLLRGDALWEDVMFESRRIVAEWLCSDALQIAIITIVDEIAGRDMWRLNSVEAALAKLHAASWC